MKQYLAYDEGCYECGEPSGVLGLYHSLQEAEEAVSRAQERQQKDWHWMHVIDLAAPELSAYSDQLSVIDGSVTTTPKELAP